MATMTRMATFTSIDDYVASFPDGPREILEQVRDAMRRGAPVDLVPTFRSS